MSDPVTTCVGAACAIKKGLFALPFIGIGIGMVVAKTGTLSIDVIKNWSIVAAALGTAFYVGSIAKGVTAQNEINDLQHLALNAYINTEILELKQNIENELVSLRYKTEYAYGQANQGNRYTFTMSQEDKKMMNASIKENSAEDNMRYDSVAKAFIEANKRMTRIFERMDKIEEIK